MELEAGRMILRLKTKSMVEVRHPGDGRRNPAVEIMEKKGRTNRSVNITHGRVGVKTKLMRVGI